MSIVERALQKAQNLKPENKVGEPRRGPLVPPSTSRDLPPVIHRKMTVDRARLRAEGALPPVNHERDLAEQFRRIKRPLVAYALTPADDGTSASRHIIVVASAIPGEGKTFTAVNLAISLSQEKDVSVLLVDGDIAKPHVSEMFGMRGERGLFDALADDTVDAESLIVDTDIPGLSFLAAGVSHNGAAELLASNRMNALMTQVVARESCRLVVIDSPPLLLTNESRELVNVAGQIVLVVHATSTEQSAVTDAVALIPEGKNVGLILNQVDPASPDVRIYGYGRYGTYPTTSEAAG
jgi:exopolysaccharide/PEP-CTERM locus tyrosine autokinase